MLCIDTLSKKYAIFDQANLSSNKQIVLFLLWLLRQTQ
jgi:hypothetical protein